MYEDNKRQTDHQLFTHSLPLNYLFVIQLNSSTQFASYFDSKLLSFEAQNWRHPAAPAIPEARASHVNATHSWPLFDLYVNLFKVFRVSNYIKEPYKYAFCTFR